MVYVAIVDDEIQQVERLHQIVSSYLKERSIQSEIRCYHSGEALLEHAKKFDLLFVDIQMQGMNGIEMAQRLRVVNKTAALLYVTSHQEQIQKSMTIHPYAFITKPFSEEEIQQNLDDYFSYASAQAGRRKRDVYPLALSHDETRYVKINNIYYFHYLKNRTIEVMTTSGKFRIRDGLQHISETMDRQDFLMPNQSFLVNLNWVESIRGEKKSLIMKNGVPILIARRKYEELLQAYHRWMMGEL